MPTRRLNINTALRADLKKDGVLEPLKQGGLPAFILQNIIALRDNEQYDLFTALNTYFIMLGLNSLSQSLTKYHQLISQQESESPPAELSFPTDTLQSEYRKDLEYSKVTAYFTTTVAVVGQLASDLSCKHQDKIITAMQHKLENADENKFIFEDTKRHHEKVITELTAQRHGFKDRNGFTKTARLSYNCVETLVFVLLLARVVHNIQHAVKTHGIKNWRCFTLYGTTSQRQAQEAIYRLENRAKPREGRECQLNNVGSKILVENKGEYFQTRPRF